MCTSQVSAVGIAALLQAQSDADARCTALQSELDSKLQQLESAEAQIAEQRVNITSVEEANAQLKVCVEHVDVGVQLNGLLGW